jgi:hypothetical protein
MATNDDDRFEGCPDRLAAMTIHVLTQDKAESNARPGIIFKGPPPEDDCVGRCVLCFVLGMILAVPVVIGMLAYWS